MPRGRGGLPGSRGTPSGPDRPAGQHRRPVPGPPQRLRMPLNQDPPGPCPYPGRDLPIPGPGLPHGRPTRVNPRQPNPRQPNSQRARPNQG